MLPSLPALRGFDAAARMGSFRAAAEALSVTPTAISHHVRSLEEQLGTQLFHRTGRTVSLTEDGRRLAQNHRAGLWHARGKPSTPCAARHANVVRIAAGPIFTARWLMPRISDFWERHPGIELEVVPTYQPRMLDRNDADIVIRWERFSEAPQGAVKLVELQPVAVASRDFITRYGPFDRPADLLGIPILHQRDHWGWQDWFHALGVAAPGQLRGPVFQDANVLLRGAAEGQGAILGWLPFVGQDLIEGRVERLFDEEIPPTQGYFMDVWDGNPSKKGIRTVANWLQASIA